MTLGKHLVLSAARTTKCTPIAQGPVHTEHCSGRDSRQEPSLSCGSGGSARRLNGGGGVSSKGNPPRRRGQGRRERGPGAKWPASLGRSLGLSKPAFARWLQQEAWWRRRSGGLHSGSASQLPHADRPRPWPAEHLGKHAQPRPAGLRRPRAAAATSKRGVAAGGERAAGHLLRVSALAVGGTAVPWRRHLQTSRSPRRPELLTLVPSAGACRALC